MINRFFLLFLFFSLSILYSFQPTEAIENFQRVNVFNDDATNQKVRLQSLEQKFRKIDSITKRNNEILTQSIDATNKNIDDKRLRQSIQSAETTINIQNSIISGLSNILTVLAILIALLTIALPILTIYMNTNIKKDVKEFLIEAQNKQKDIISEHSKLKEINETQISNFKEEKERLFIGIKTELNKKFEEYLVINKKQRIDQALINLTSDDQGFINDACSHISLTPIGDFSEDQLSRIIKVLKSRKLSKDRLEMLIRKIAEKQCDFTDNFFETLCSIQSINTKEIRNIAYLYFEKNDILNYKMTLIKLINASDEPTLEYGNVIDCYKSGYQDSLLKILNFEELQSNSKINLVTINQKLETIYNYKEIVEQIHQSIFYAMFIESTGQESISTYLS